MATLHVRNVPEPLYEALRARAEREGRSIGSQTCLLLEQALLVETLKLPARRASAGAVAPWERFAPAARDAVAQASKEAAELGHDSIDTEHVLLGLLADVSTTAAHVLEAFGVDRAAVLDRVPSGPKKRRSTRSLPFSPAVKEVLELALRESLAQGGLGQGSIDTHHVLVGLATYEPGRAAQILRELGVEASMVRAGAARMLAVGVPRPFPWLPAGVTGPAWEYQTIDLTGDSKAWSQQLNDAASEGWELFSVAEGDSPRAILRRASR